MRRKYLHNLEDWQSFKCAVTMGDKKPRVRERLNILSFHLLSETVDAALPVLPHPAEVPAGGISRGAHSPRLPLAGASRSAGARIAAGGSSSCLGCF